MSEAELASTPVIDYFRPIVADGDTGHGGLTAVMKVSCSTLFEYSNL